MDKKIGVMGLTNHQWKEFSELLIHANKHQLSKMIILATIQAGKNEE